jgi:putative transposase
MKNQRPMQKEEFTEIISRQVSSGLSIKEFCMNESYTSSNFYYWKSKFGFARPCNKFPKGSNGFAPIDLLSKEERYNSPKETETDITESEICIEYPTGVKIHFKGMSETGIALNIISKISSSHVLPE